VVFSPYTRHLLNEVVAADAVTIRTNIWDAKRTSIWEDALQSSDQHERRIDYSAKSSAAHARCE